MTRRLKFWFIFKVVLFSLFNDKNQLPSAAARFWPLVFFWTFFLTTFLRFRVFSGDISCLISTYIVIATITNLPTASVSESEEDEDDDDVLELLDDDLDKSESESDDKAVEKMW